MNITGLISLSITNTILWSCKYESIEHRTSILETWKAFLLILKFEGLYQINITPDAFFE
jgi:hypothetical protein